MKSYPSIEKALTPPDLPLYTWDKIDGSNLRFEWSRKAGWMKFGTRDRLFDETDEVFGAAIALFRNTMGEPLTAYARKMRWDALVVFAEFAGERSFAGLHHPDDEKKLYLIDASPHRVGIMDPRDFLELVEKTHVQTTRYLGRIKWNRTFLDDVARKELPEITCEGVVGKVMDGRRLLMWKTKTDQWKEMVRNKFDTAVALKLIES